jgi:hypothetical protein
MKLLTLLQQLFGKRYVNKIIGTKTNVTKPIQMDKSSPFKRYSNSAFDDPELIAEIEKKIDEYAPYALSNRNKEELANFEDNAQRLLQAKNKQTGTTPGMAQQIAESMFGPIGKKVKPEAEIVDIRTQQKIKPEGIETLKSEIGLPEGVEPGSVADKAIKESAQYKMDQQGVKSLLDENYNAPKTTSIAEDMSLENRLSEQGARAYSANIESFRRPIVREMLLKDTKIKLPDDVRKSLENKDDLQRGANPEMDPLRLLNEYYDVNFDKLDELEEIRFTARNATEAADEFLKKGGLQPKKDLGDKLKDLPDDIDPDALANGGRPGGRIMTPEEYFKGKNKFNKQRTYEQMRQEYEEYLYKQKYGPRDSAAVGGRIGFKKGGIKDILKKLNEKFGKGTVTTAENMELSPDVLQKKMLEKEFDAFNKRNRKLTEEEYEDLVAEYGEGVPQLETVADAERFVQGQKDYQAAMFRDYKAGKLDPKPGEPGRKRLLEKKMEEMEMSGDKKLMTQDEIDELMMLQTEELAPQMTERMQLKIKYPGITDDLIQKIMIDDNPQRKAEVLATLDEAYKMVDKGMSSDEILNAIKTTPRTKQADGGLNYLMGF